MTATIGAALSLVVIVCAGCGGSGKTISPGAANEQTRVEQMAINSATRGTPAKHARSVSCSAVRTSLGVPEGKRPVTWDCALSYADDTTQHCRLVLPGPKSVSCTTGRP